MKDFLQLQHPLALVLREPCDGDARPAGHHLGDVLLAHGAPVHGQIFAPVFPLDLHLLHIVLFNVPELGGPLIVLCRNDLRLLPAQGGNLLLQTFQLRGGGFGVHAHPAGSLVHEVDGLIRQESVVDVPHAQTHGAFNGLVGDGQLMVRLVFIPQTLQNFNGGLRRRLAYSHRLEPAFQSGILLDVLAVLVEGGGAHHTNFAPGQGGLEDVGGVHGPFGGACAHDGVQLVDEEDHIAGLLHLVDGLLDTLFKLAPVFGAGHHARQIQREHPLVQQLLRHIRRGDALGKTLGDGRLAHTRLTDENGIVLGTPGQDLDHPLDLLFSADDGIQLTLPGTLRQIPGKLRQSFAFLALLPVGDGHIVVCGCPGAFVDLLHHGAVHLLGVNAHGVQYPDGHIAALPQQAQQQMLRSDVSGAHAHGLGHGQLHGALGPGGKPLGRCRAGQTLAHTALQHGADHVLRHAVFPHDPVGNAVLLPHESQQDMLGAHIAVAHFFGGLLRQTQGLLCPGSELIFMCHIEHFLSL